MYMPRQQQRLISCNAVWKHAAHAERFMKGVATRRRCNRMHERCSRDNTVDVQHAVSICICSMLPYSTQLIQCSKALLT